MKDNCSIEPVILTRTNSKVKELKHDLSAEDSNHNLLNQLYASESDKKRPAFIHSLLVARDYFIKCDNKNSMKEISKYLKLNKNGQRVSSLTIRKLSVSILDIVSDNGFLDKAILEAYTSIVQLLKNHDIKVAGKYGNGKAKKFVEIHTFADLVPYIKTETSQEEMIRTIHSAKGAEFDSVLLVIEEEKDFKKWIVDCTNQIESVQRMMQGYTTLL